MKGILSEFTGRVITEPELHFLSSGVALLKFLLAVHDENTSGKADQVVQVTIWGDKAQDTHDAGRIHKGHTLYVHGKLRFNSWVSNDGVHRSGLQLNAWTVEPIGVTQTTLRPVAAAPLK